MKRLKVIFLFTLVASVTGLSQDFAKVKNPRDQEFHDWKSIYLKTNPFPIIQGPIPATAEYRVGFEAMAAPRLSYQPSISFLGKSPLFSLFFPDSALSGFTSRDFLIRGYRLQGQLRYFYLMFSNKGPDAHMRPSGLYMALHSSYSTATLRLRSFTYPRLTINHFNVNALFGIQVLMKDAVGLDIFAGLGYKENTIFETDQNQNVTQLDLEEEGFGPYYSSNIKVSLGFNLAIGLW